ncbi:sugar phosphate nucleotidyltransferase [Halorhabdus rudnickae]|uniref:sugar phosphate nucleotidyltransferase n=1 Tax=Halorhabdus rudnickae TaxID=1775544 RepID=UPI001082A4F2|nr:sugar phosphate nucleotidyltransferase [Halorhabdus rudnickae]
MAKKRISLTLDEDLVETLDRRIEEEGIGNRSKGVETFLRDYLRSQGVRTAVILGGGRESSCLVEVDDEPAIAHALTFLTEAGIERVYVATADPPVRTYLEAEAPDVNVLYEDEAMGTAGSLDRIDIAEDETFLVMNGDVLCDIDVGDMARTHWDSDVLATMALTTSGETSEYGVVQMKGNQIVGFTEKPEESESHLINAGVYLLEGAFLNRVPEGRSQLADLFEQLAGEGELAGYVYDGEWREAT